MPGAKRSDLSRRERQIMDVVWANGEATAQEIQDRIPDAPSYSAVRALLRVLVRKGHLAYHSDGPRYVYRPTQSRSRVRRTALAHLVDTFFDGSAEGAVAALLDLKKNGLSEEEYERLRERIDRARREGR